MKLNKSKKGISLIVLVITIIVMIILATAIILSLNSSNISGKAGEARLASDLANKKEAASVYLSEYEIKVAKGKIDKNTTTADDYVKSECKKSGIGTSDVVVTDKGNILTGIAALFVNNNVPIGTKIEGYVLNNTTTYKTSGKENTYKSATEECDPISATLTRDSEIQWKYMGIDENGEALIVGSLGANSPTIILGALGGYLYGPQELNNACKALYSSSMGTARSINIDDVTRVLEYTGEKGQYYMGSTIGYVKTPRAKTLNEIANEIGYNMSSFLSNTPEAGKEIGKYKSDYYEINISNEEDKKQYNSSTENINVTNLIFPGNSDLLARYWIASSCCFGRFYYNDAAFLVRRMIGSGLSAWDMFRSGGNYYSREEAIRPVVSLNPSVQMTYDSLNKTVTLK